MRLASLLFALTLAVACRPDPGTPDYPQRTAFTDPDDPFLPGADPYTEGDDRLSVGLWYEGGASEVVELGTGADYYIYENTYTEGVTDDRVEGFEAARIELTGQGGFFGGGITWASPRDLSGWQTLHIALKSDAEVFDDLEVRMIGGSISAVARARTYGFATDGGWHDLFIPLSDLALQGIDLTSVTEPIQLIAPATDPGGVLLVDDLWFSGEAPPVTTPTTPTVDTSDTGLPTTPATTTGFLPGPDPWAAGDERLAFGLFYEGGASEVLLVDDETAFYYIYDGTYTSTTTDDRVQGFEADALELSGLGGYFGGGITLATPADLSAWTRMTLSVKSSDTVFEALDVRMVGGGVQGSVRATDVGFATDGTWHTVHIPLADFASQGVDLSQVTEPLQLLGEATEAGAVLVVDNVYLDKE